MFQNCVFCNTVDTRQWFKAAVIRALKTMAQAATSVIGIPEVEAKKCSENAMASKSETKAVAEGTVDE